MDSMTIAIILLIVGLILLGIEALIPGFGISGISGVACVAVAILILADSVLEAVALLAFFALTAGVGFFVLTRLLKLNRLVLGEQEDPDKGYTAFRVDATLVGKTGEAYTDLHPTGGALVEGERLDVITQGEYLPRGSKIKIMNVQGMRILVKLEECE